MTIIVKVGQWINDANAKFAACMSTSIQGTVGSYLPDGDIYAFLAQDIKDLSTWGDKLKVSAGHQTIKFPSDKVYVAIQLVNCSLGKEKAATATAELNVLKAFVNTLGVFGALRVYFWVKNTANNTYINLTRNSGGTEIRPIYGFPKDPIKWEMKAGESGTYTFPFTFEEVTVG